MNSTIENTKDEKPKNWIKEHPILSIIIGIFLLNFLFVPFALMGSINSSSSNIAGNSIKSDSLTAEQSTTMAVDSTNVPKTTIPITSTTPTTNLADVSTPPNTEDLTDYEYTSSDNLYKVTRVIDGDTIVLSTDEKVRLICINTPEVGEDYYGEASDRLSELILNKEVELVKDKSETDRYGRLLRYIYLDGDFINEQMVKEGYAKAYPYSPDLTKCPQIESAEAYAKSHSLGLWGLAYDDSDSTTDVSANIIADDDKDSTSTGSEVCKCDLNTYNCDDFQTHLEAQACYDYCVSLGKGDIHRLDGNDNDGSACESLP